MPQENPEVELKRLRREQTKTRDDEVFGGLTPAERAAFNARTKRINELEIELAAIAFAKKIAQHAKANQKEQWSKVSETDTPQDEAHQPYRSRESDSANSSRDLKRGNEEKRRGSLRTKAVSEQS